MLNLLAILVLSQIQPGPVDAYRANLNSSKLTIDFTYRTEFASWNSIGHRLRAFEPGRELITDAQFSVGGKWETDGSTEHFIIHDKKTVSDLKANAIGNAEETPYEAMFNNEYFAFFMPSDTRNVLDVRKTSVAVLSLFGPNEFWQTNFLQLMHEEFNNKAQVMKKINHFGKSLELEFFKEGVKDGFKQLEVYYDPSVGYLPRFARISFFETTSKRAYIKEYYLISAYQCKSGGYIAIEYFDNTYRMENAEIIYANFPYNSEPTPQGRIKIGHFKASNQVEKIDPVRFEQLGEPVKNILVPGGLVPLQRAHPTLQEIKEACGTRLDNVSAMLIPLNPHQVEIVHETSSHNLLSNRQIASAIVFFMSVFGIILIGKRVSKRAYILLFCLFFCGCGHIHEDKANQLVTVTTKIEPEILLCDTNDSTLNLKLNITNHGNQLLKIFGIDGGCSCRKIDRSVFPLVLKPGETKSAPITIQNRKSSETQAIVFKCESNYGVLSSVTNFTALANVSFSPDTVMLTGLNELTHKDREFSVTLRRIANRGTSFTKPIPVFPPSITLISSKDLTKVEVINNANKFAYKEYYYSFALKDKAMGLHKAEIEFFDRHDNSSDSSKVCVIPVIWQRNPFLNTIPERLYVNRTALRLFLNCQDDSVELIKILNCPPGLRAVITSPKEISITPLDSTQIPNGSILEVETSYKPNSLLRVPIATPNNSVPPAS